MATQAERRAATRTRVVTAARRLFAHQGYEATTTEQILDEAGVSRGAMYHHFPTKRDVFEAVFVDVSDETLDRANRAGVGQSSPFQALLGASLAWLAEVRQPEIAAILLDQGPQVLGWRRARDLEAETSLGMVEAALERAAAAGEVEIGSIGFTARLLNAMVAEAALTMQHGDTTPAEQEAELRRLLEGWLST
ncbi:MAG: helix-turn-helix domain-containing protein [Actinomycetota bacterium]